VLTHPIIDATSAFRLMHEEKQIGKIALTVHNALGIVVELRPQLTLTATAELTQGTFLVTHRLNGLEQGLLRWARLHGLPKLALLHLASDEELRARDKSSNVGQCIDSLRNHACTVNVDQMDAADRPAMKPTMSSKSCAFTNHGGLTAPDSIMPPCACPSRLSSAGLVR
jgi:hypothetical protein